MKRANNTALYPSEQAMRGIEADVLPGNLRALLAEGAKQHCDRNVAVFFDDDVTVTYGELARDVDRLASALAARGVTFGTHVGIMLKTGPYYPVSWLAVTTLGAVAVPINPAYTSRELAFVIDDSNVGFLIIQDAFLPVLEEAKVTDLAHTDILVAGAASARYLAWDEVIATGREDFIPEQAPTLEDAANIQYTSGTTGLPKGAIIPHGFWVLRGKVWQTQIRFPIARNLIAQPLHYIDGQAMFLLTLYSGGTAYIAAKQSSRRFLKWVKDFSIEFCSLPEIVARQIGEGAIFKSSLRIAYAYSHRKESYRVNEERMGCPLRQGYGMTEIGSALYVPVEADHMTGTGTAGIPSAFREVMIADKHGNPVNRGESGEIYVRGNHMFKGYNNRPEATAAAIAPEGWLRTGDVGYQDEAGWFFYQGRQKDMVRRSSENISAFEVEEVLRGVPGIVEAAVLAVPDEARGEEVKAYIRLEKGQDVSDVPPERIIAHCNNNLARFKIPRFLEYVQEFPRTPGNKIKKSELIEANVDLRVGAYDTIEGRWRD